MRLKKGVYLLDMDEFLQYLSNKRIANAKIRAFYAQWVHMLYNFVDKRHTDPLLDTDIEKFLATMGGTHHDWQVKQAEDAIRLYLYFQSQSKSLQVKKLRFLSVCGRTPLNRWLRLCV